MHVLSREPREAELFSGRLDADEAARAARRARRRRRRRPLVAVRPARHGHRRRSEVLAELGVARDAGAPGAVLRRRAAAASCTAPDAGGRGRDQRGHGRPRRPRHHAHPAPRASRSSTPRSRSAPTCRSPARAASAAPAGPGSPTARSTMRRNFALEDDEVDAGFVLTCQSLPGLRRGDRRLRRLTAQPRTGVGHRRRSRPDRAGCRAASCRGARVVSRCGGR